MDELQTIIDTLDSGVKSILGSPRKWWEKVWALAELVVPQVEKFSNLFQGSAKKDIALQLIDDIYFKYADIKFIPNPIEKWIVNSVAGAAIDKIVALLNKNGTFKHA